MQISDLMVHSGFTIWAKIISTTMDSRT